MTQPVAMSLTAIGAGAFTATTFGASAIAPMNIGNVTQRADKIIPQTATESLFTIGTAPIWLFHIYGQVGTVIGSVANASKLQAKATGQTAVDMCATLDLNAAAASIYLQITGTAANAMVKNFGGPIQATAWLILPGTIDLTTAGNSVTGTARWVAHWVAAEPGATLVAA